MTIRREDNNNNWDDVCKGDDNLLDIPTFAKEYFIQMLSSHQTKPTESRRPRNHAHITVDDYTTTNVLFLGSLLSLGRGVGGMGGLRSGA